MVVSSHGVKCEPSHSWGKLGHNRKQHLLKCVRVTVEAHVVRVISDEIPVKTRVRRIRRHTSV